ncbi:MAG: F0F1 ATP synthase subunit gamma [Alphaproteobacteria bacterium]|nr:F0F1 ATP synthase subunit gamma [Alphaproteobacteria bacterium]
MPSLKEFRNRIASVKSTRKITSAMKMVAASKLRRAQMQAEQSQPYAKRMAAMLARLASNINIGAHLPVLIAGTGKADVHLLVVVTSDRGLCGGFNGSISRLARQKIRELRGEGKQVKLLCVGRKGRDALKREFADDIVHSFEGLGRKGLAFDEAAQVSQYILDLLDNGGFDVCTVLYNQFKSVIAQEPVAQQMIPLSVETPASEGAKEETPAETEEKSGPVAIYEFEPGEEEILASLLPRNLSVQIFRALLDSAAGEQAARMTAMDNATRNAGDMINSLTLRYNRARQAYITKELIEIISGAEAV